ncbi:MAG: DNA primase [Acidiphilium sp. 21-66-27]|nr:MAG: DNA primase [Acidiphilium sp. 21-66-27]
MSGSAAELAHRLAREAEAVCRHYLSNGRRQGRYWLVGDVQNSPGRSLFVRLTGPDSGRGAAGKWTDAATGQHGDLIDLIRLNRGLDRLGDALGEARAFLGLRKPGLPRAPARAGSSNSARRLFALSRPIVGTLAETYLRNRGITAGLEGMPALRFHPACFYRAHDAAPREAWPALIAAVTNPDGTITGVHRTWLDRDGAGKAPIATPRRALGHLLGNAVRFGMPSDVMIAGEGIETMLSLRCLLPDMPMVAALSANHLTALILPPALRRLYIARDNDAAGRHAAMRLRDRARAAGIDVRIPWPVTNDFNADLRRFGADALLARLRVQLTPEDAERFASGGIRRVASA